MYLHLFRGLGPIGSYGRSGLQSVVWFLVLHLLIDDAGLRLVVGYKALFHCLQAVLDDC